MTDVLTVDALSVGYRHAGGDVVTVVQDVSFGLREGTLLGLAGESGCGKSTAALRSIGFPIPDSVLLGGTAHIGTVDLLAAPVDGLRRLWGSQVAYVAQDATQSLSPLMRVGRSLA